MDIVPIIIIVFLGGISLLIWYQTKGFSHSQQNDGRNNKVVIGPQYKEMPSPKQIMAEVSKLSPIQSQDPSRNYRGLLVKWQVTYESASMRNLDGTMDLWFSPRSHKPYFRVVCAVDLEQYPRMETMKAGHEMWVAGTIESVYPPTMIRLAPGAILKI